MSVYNQPTSNVQSDGSDGPLSPGTVSALATPLVQGFNFVVNAFTPPGHSDEAAESLSDSSSYFSLSSSSSSSLSSEVNALSVDVYLRSDDANADAVHNPAEQPSGGVDLRDDRSDASTEIVDEEDYMDTPHSHVIDINEGSTLMNSNVASSDSIGPQSTLYVQLTESETFYADSVPEENRRQRITFSEEHWNNVLNAQRALVARAEVWAKTCARQEQIEKRQREERLVREREDIQRRREAAERAEDHRLEMLVEEAELEMEQKERNKYLLEGEREMRRQQEFREAAACEDQRLQDEYLTTREDTLEAKRSFKLRFLGDVNEFKERLISVDEFYARSAVDGSHMGTPAMPGNYHYTHEHSSTSRSSRNRFHPYSNALEFVRSKNCQYHKIGADFSLPAGLRIFKTYLEKWDWITTPGNEVALTFRTVPWPLTYSPHTPVEFTKSRVWLFLSCGVFHGVVPSPEERKYVIVRELRRWYPDSVETWIIPCIVTEAERVAVREAAAAVQKVLVLLMSST